MTFKLKFEDGSDGYLAQTELDPKEVERRHYAFPEERKFPLTDTSKVMSAIKFFNYVDPKNERRLAEAILKRMEDLGISEVNVGPDNRFGKHYKASENYLSHHGIKGMHWGVWNDETRARRLGLHLGKTGKNSSKNPKGIANKHKSFSYKESETYKKALVDYRKGGYSEKDARDMARGRVYAKRVLIGGAIIVGTAAAVAVGYTVYNKYANRVITPKTVLQTIHKGDIGARLGRESFYASYGKADNLLYKARLGMHKEMPAFESKISHIAANRNIKMAGEITARKEFKALCEADHEFYNLVRKNFTNKLPENPAKISSSVWKRAYIDFNREGLIMPNPARTKYYEHLRGKGFGAVLDMNDAKVAGWTFHPAIIFDTNATGNNLKTLSSRRLRLKDGRGANRVGAMALEKVRTTMNYPLQSEEVQMTMVYGAAAASVYGISVADSKARAKFAENYKKEHPNTKKSYAELKKMYEQEHSFYI